MCHKSEGGEGHYYCVVRHEGKWYSINDTEIHPVSNLFVDSVHWISTSFLAIQNPWSPPSAPSKAFSVYPLSYHDLTLNEADYPVQEKQAVASTPSHMLDSANNDLSSMPLPVLDEALPRSEREDACSAPFISDIVNGIASMYASKQDDDAFADRLASTANRITSTPAPVGGKGDYYNKTDNSVPFYPPAPTGFLKTASTSALAAKKMISLPEEKENEESEEDVPRTRSRTRGRGRGRGRAARGGKRTTAEVNTSIPEDLFSLLHSFSSEGDSGVPFNITRFFNNYNSILSNQLYSMMLEPELPKKRGKKRQQPSTGLTEEDINEMQRFVRENKNNIKKMQSVLSLLNQIGDEASRVVPEADELEKGGCVGTVVVDDSEFDRNVVMCLYVVTVRRHM